MTSITPTEQFEPADQLAGSPSAHPGRTVDPLAGIGEDTPARRQPGQLVELFLEGREDGPPVIVRVANRERIHYERTAAKHRWPAATDAQNLAMTFVCWSAAKRAGLTDATFEQFEDVLIDYELIDQAPADPTRPGA